MGSTFWCTKHPNAPTLRCLPLRFVLITVQIVYIYGIPPCSPEVPHPGPCKKRSILQRDRASTAAGGQNCRAPYHSKSRHGENDAPLLRKTAKSDSERSLGISEGRRWQYRIVCNQLELLNTPKMHDAPHGTHCRMTENRSSASPRCIPEKITFGLAMDTVNKRARALFARALLFVSR